MATARTTTWTAATAFLAILALPGPGPAQQSGRILITDLPLVEQARIQQEKEARATEASELLEEARAAERAGEWKKAARTYRESGRLRTDGDRLSAEVFALAGRAYHFSGDPRRASAMWEEAASRSLIHGDVEGAARHFMYAAVAAKEAGARVRASELGWKAYHLTRSPVLSRAQREELRANLRVSPEQSG